MVEEPYSGNRIAIMGLGLLTAISPTGKIVIMTKSWWLTPIPFGPSVRFETKDALLKAAMSWKPPFQIYDPDDKQWWIDRENGELKPVP